MTLPLKNADGALAEFQTTDRIPITAMPQTLPLPTFDSAGSLIVVDLLVQHALEDVIVAELNDASRAYATRRSERASLIDRRGNIGTRGVVR